MNKIGGYIFQIVLMLFCFGELINSDAYYISYLIILGIGVVCTYNNINNRKASDSKLTGIARVLVITFATVFSLMVTLSNYSLWLDAYVPDYAGNVFKKIYKLS